MLLWAYACSGREPGVELPKQGPAYWVSTGEMGGQIANLDLTHKPSSW